MTIDWTKVVTAEDKFNTLKKEKYEYIARSRWEEETEPFYYAPKEARFDTSERSQIKYLQALSKGMTTMWKTFDGWVEMTPEDFAGLINTYEAFVAVLFEKEATLQQQLMLAENNEDLDLIVW